MERNFQLCEDNLINLWTINVHFYDFIFSSVNNAFLASYINLS